MSNQSDKKKAAPYLAFATFTNALDNVAAHSVPNIIDRSSFPSFSGGAVAATLSSFRFFGLIDDDGRPTEALHDLAMNKDKREPNIKALLEEHYQSLIALDLSRATPSQFDDAFSSEAFGVSGDTRVKSKIFFIKAAQYAKIPISKLLLKKSRSSGPRKARKAKAASTENGADIFKAQDPPVATPITSGNHATKIVRLNGGGTVMLTASVDVLSLTGKDREFVFSVIDLLNGYESEGNTSE